MAKVGKLTKLKSAIKRWPSFTKFTRTTSCSSSAAANFSPENKNDDVVLRAVYVGKARRRYLVSSEVVEHPLFQELVDKSGGGEGRHVDADQDDGSVSVACEVVLFEHLLWILDNNSEDQLGSTHELVEFYTC
ncbi:hypothetical protein L484_005029 [Morus notabilis]|uniref:Uncharacterized protein n=1 Tax=Morus notabilis TaxID=981085 RepID=W9RP98_9ROSA|nr:uncharacterized protein LOC21388514 [Morus notabilis]EXC01330.1 hypothetical protein L484_005029 [Morus notabilis]